MVAQRKAAAILVDVAAWRKHQLERKQQLSGAQSCITMLLRL